MTNAHDHLAPDPAERFATTLQCLTKAVLAMMGGERLPLALISLIVDRNPTHQAAICLPGRRVGAGRYTPQNRSAPPRRRPEQPPHAPRLKRETPPPLARSRSDFHKGLPPLFPDSPRFVAKPPAKKPGPSTARVPHVQIAVL